MSPALTPAGVGEKARMSVCSVVAPITTGPGGGAVGVLARHLVGLDELRLGGSTLVEPLLGLGGPALGHVPRRVDVATGLGDVTSPIIAGWITQ